MRACTRSDSSSGYVRVAAAGNARTTRSTPTGNSTRCVRTMWRKRRRTLLRTTALPTALETTNPARDDGWTPSARAGSDGACGAGTTRCTTSAPRAARRPPRTVAEKSSRRRRRSAAASTGIPVTSGRKGDATLSPTGREDRAPGAGAHAQPEAVGLRTPAVVRLVGALAHVRHSVFICPASL